MPHVDIRGKEVEIMVILLKYISYMYIIVLGTHNYIIMCSILNINTLLYNITKLT